MSKEYSNLGLTQRTDRLKAQALKKQELSFILQIPFDKLITKIEPLTIDSSVIFSVNEDGAEYGNLSYIRVIADGIHDPSFGLPLQKMANSIAYDNSIGAINLVSFWFDGTSYLYSINQII